MAQHHSDQGVSAVEGRLCDIQDTPYSHDTWIDPAKFVAEDLEMIISDSDEVIEPAVPKERKPKGKENLAVIDPFMNPPNPLAPFSFINMLDRVLGRLAPKEQLFCPFAAVSKYPYRYVQGHDSEAVSKAYFAGGKFKARGWSLYYIHTLLNSRQSKPLILLAAVEVEALLSEINEKLNLQLKFPHPREAPGFLLDFLQKGSPRPRYLGQMTAEHRLETMEAKIPGPAFKEREEDLDVDVRSFPAFKLKMEAALQAGRNRTKASKEKKKTARVIEKKGCCAQLKRTQCYLGVRPQWKISVDPHSIPGLSWLELQEAIKEHEAAKTERQQLIDSSKPVPHNFYENVVFICVDVESYERHRKTITEVGISTLDTNDIMDLAPGDGGEAWMKKIRSRHFRIKEHSHLNNTEFVTGCADRFEKDFGVSEWISIDEAPQVIASCFRAPFSGPSAIKNSADKSDIHESSQSNLAISDLSPDSTPLEHSNESKPLRKIVLVGHDIKVDVEYLHNMGYDVNNLSNLLEAIDTIDLYRAFKHEQQGKKLGSILLELGLTGWNLHNAGNDAAYTLQAMIGIALKALDAKRNHHETMAAVRASRLEEAAKDATEHVMEDWEEWNLADNEESDGGAPVPMLRQDEKLVPSKPEKGDSNVLKAEREAKEKLEAKTQDDAEAARLAIAVGDDVGAENSDSADSKGSFPGNIVVKQTVLDWQSTVEADNRSSPAPMWAPNDADEQIDSALEDNSTPEGAIHTTEETSPIAAHIEERLAFLESLDTEDGGVKL